MSGVYCLVFKELNMFCMYMHDCTAPSNSSAWPAVAVRRPVAGNLLMRDRMWRFTACHDSWLMHACHLPGLRPGVRERIVVHFDFAHQTDRVPANGNEQLPLSNGPINFIVLVCNLQWHSGKTEVECPCCLSAK